MTFTPADLSRLVAALILLLAFSHGFGYVFRRFRQPQVIGEILGGLLLGPTVLGWFLPVLYRTVFIEHSPTLTVLGAIYQLGLLLLMFCSGMEIRSSFQPGEKKIALCITLIGTIAPLAIGYAIFQGIDSSRFIGEAQSREALLLVFVIAVAVTSIPVISRIMMDLKIIKTPFARIVLSSAVIEDVVLYVLLGIALSLGVSKTGQAFGLPGMIGFASGSGAEMAYHSVATIGFFGLSLFAGPVAFRKIEAFRFNILRKNSPVAFLLLFMMALTAVALFFGVAPMFGAFVAGLVAGQSVGDLQGPREAIKTFSFAFFIPVYFAIVGLKLDLIRDFDPLFFAAFLVAACMIKLASVYVGARLAGEKNWGAVNLAVAMNARGGPGIVLASVALDAKLINGSFYATLILLALVTSLLAGSWLNFVVSKKWELT